MESVRMVSMASRSSLSTGAVIRSSVTFHTVAVAAPAPGGTRPSGRRRGVEGWNTVSLDGLGEGRQLSATWPSREAPRGHFHPIDALGRSRLSFYGRSRPAVRLAAGRCRSLRLRRGLRATGRLLHSPRRWRSLLKRRDRDLRSAQAHGPIRSMKRGSHMRIYDGSPRQNYEEVLRSIGAFLDQRGMRETMVVEAPDGFVVQGLVVDTAAQGTWSEHLGKQSKETFTFLDDDIARFMALDVGQAL